MPTIVIMPALEMAQETGKVVRWLKAPGDAVAKGEPIVEIETDKVTVEVEAPAAGILGDVTAGEGDVVPVGQGIARVFAPGEARSTEAAMPKLGPAAAAGASPLAREVAEPRVASRETDGAVARLMAASPKARRLAAERGFDLGALRGSGPGGAVLAADVPPAVEPPAAPAEPRVAAPGVGTVWRVMAERMTASWTTAPHFYLVREVDASRLVAWRERVKSPAGARITYTDLLVRLVAAALSRHPTVNAAWKDGTIAQAADISIGLAVAIDAGLVVPVIHRADTLSLAELATRREDIVSRAQAGRLRPADIQGGGFTISNLGMFGVDAFSAIVNPPQAAILAVGRIADRVVAVNGQPVVRPTMVLTLSCDHRALDGARGAQFLGALADLVEEPLALLT
jgi:pyruvate dehydrogenase E2 component (dihydrolipoamide acetyltransferase)